MFSTDAFIIVLFRIGHYIFVSSIWFIPIHLDIFKYKLHISSAVAYYYLQLFVEHHIFQTQFKIHL